MTEEIISIETLQEKLNTITQDFTKRQKRYYYTESIQNFIYHLNSFPSERTQKRMGGKINDYLLLLQEQVNEEHDLHQLAKQLFPHIWKIGVVYNDELGFINKPSYFLRLILGLLIFFILKSIFGNYVALGSVAVLAIVTTVRSEMKIRAKKYW